MEACNLVGGSSLSKRRSSGVRLLKYEEDLSSSPMTDHLHVVVGVSTARAGSQESVVAASVCACCVVICEAQDSRRSAFIIYTIQILRYFLQ